MASSFTNLGIELMATGENAGTWGNKTNTNLQIVQQISGGYQEQALTRWWNFALAKNDGATGATLANRVWKLTGALTGSSIGHCY